MLHGNSALLFKFVDLFIIISTYCDFKRLKNMPDLYNKRVFELKNRLKAYHAMSDARVTPTEE